MAQTVKILNWNIQNYGPKKSSFNDIVQGIAKVVYARRPDIFVLLEVNTTFFSTAGAAAGELAKALYAMSRADGGSEYRLCIISPNTGLEFYAFFIRDHAYTIPLSPTRSVGGGAAGNIGGLFFPQFADVEFRQLAYAFTAGKVRVSTDACLLYPDLHKKTAFGRDLGLASWPGTRNPALGMFWCPAATGANRLLPVVACHFAANSNVATSQFNALQYFSVLGSLMPPTYLGVAPVPLSINYRLTAGGLNAANLSNYVLTGDFNVNYMSQTARRAYDSITGTYYPDLAANIAIVGGTHLVTYKSYSPRDYKSTPELAINGFDNFFVRAGNIAPAPVTFANDLITDVPGGIKNRFIRLNQSVAHYAELDQRGFSEGDYKYAAVDYAGQLKGGADVNLLGSLVGGRLVSDHIPVSFTLTIN